MLAERIVFVPLEGLRNGLFAHEDLDRTAAACAPSSSQLPITSLAVSVMSSFLDAERHTQRGPSRGMRPARPHEAAVLEKRMDHALEHRALHRYACMAQAIGIRKPFVDQGIVLRQRDPGGRHAGKARRHQRREAPVVPSASSRT